MGEFCSIITCNSCRQKVVKSETSLTMSLARKSCLDVALESYFREEIIQEYICNGCRDHGATIQTKFVVAPQYLVIHIKDPGPMAFKACLNMSPFFENAQKSAKYALKSVIVYKAFVKSSGHYFTFIKNDADVWYKADDAVVLPVDEEAVFSSNPYLLIYQRI